MASPVLEPEEEKDSETAELKTETMMESQTDGHSNDEQTEKSPAPAPPTAEPATEPAPVVPEENRVGVNAGSQRSHDLMTITKRVLIVPQPFSWASVTSKNLPPSGAVPSSGIPPHVVKATPAAPVSLLLPHQISDDVKQLIDPSEAHKHLLTDCFRPVWR